MEATVALLRRGVNGSDHMREQLARQFKLAREDQDWRRFVNYHAWALVRPQAQGRIRKIAPGQYELADGAPAATPPIRDGKPLPKWARVMISAAKQTNAAVEPGTVRGRRSESALWKVYVDWLAVQGNGGGDWQGTPSLCRVARSN